MFCSGWWHPRAARAWMRLRGLEAKGRLVASNGHQLAEEGRRMAAASIAIFCDGAASSSK